MQIDHPRVADLLSQLPPAPCRIDILVSPVGPLANLDAQEGGATVLLCGRGRSLAHIKHTEWIRSRESLEALKTQHKATEVRDMTSVTLNGAATRMYIQPMHMCGVALKSASTCSHASVCDGRDAASAFTCSVRISVASVCSAQHTLRLSCVCRLCCSQKMVSVC